MNWQPLIDYWPFIPIGIYIVIAAWAKLCDVKAKANPGIDEWDDRATRALKTQELYSEAIDWLVDSGIKSWKGGEKLAELIKLTHEFEALWGRGKQVEALATLTGFRQDAKAKLERTAQTAVNQLPFETRPSANIKSLPSPDLPLVEGLTNPDQPAVEDTDPGSNGGPAGSK